LRSPSYADPYLYQNRLNDYRGRCWFFKVLLDNAVGAKSKLVGKFQRTCYRVGNFQSIYNQNAITNTWVEMLFQNEYAIPNYMTTRVLMLLIEVVVKNHQQLLSDKHLFYCLKYV
jgi:hypothetical protein